MARSQEALLKRAEKRSVPVEIQRLKDKKRAKSSSGASSDTASPGDWQCKGCTYSNYSSRSECKKCKMGRDGGNVSTDTVKPVTFKTVTTTTAASATNTNWICHKCKNNNFANRADCNRCGELKAAVEVEKSSGSEQPNTVVKTEAVPVSNHKLKQQPIVVSNNVVKHKKYEWGKQASAEKIEENKLLLEIIKSAEANPDSGSAAILQELSPEEAERAKVLLARKKRKQEKKVKMAKMKTILAKKQEAIAAIKKGGGGGGAKKGGGAVVKSEVKTVTKLTATTSTTAVTAK